MDKPVKIMIDGKEFLTAKDTNGKALYALASIPTDRCLFREGSTQRIFNSNVAKASAAGVEYGNNITLNDGDVLYTTP